MSAEQNMRQLQEYVAAFNRDDLETMKGMWADGFRFHVGGRIPLAGNYQGFDEVLQVMKRLNEATEGLELEVRDVLADDHFIATIVRVAGEKDGRPVDLTYAGAYKVDDDGRFAEFWYLPDDQEESDRLLGTAPAVG